MPDANDRVVAPPWEDAIFSSLPVAAQSMTSRDDLAKAARLSNSQMLLIEKIQKQAAPEVVAAVKSGAISINAAAAVSSLSTEDQVAAAAAGKDELKQAAKRVRDAKRKPSEAATELSEQITVGPQDTESTGDEIKTLRKRVATLEAENASLRKQVLTLLEKRGP
jgi:ParB-like chromosome segregation protein Spo0J